MQMPYISRPKLPRGRFVALAAASAVAFLAVPAAAQAACPKTTVTKPFKAFGDTANYSLVQNGGFEYGAGGWALTGASVVAGNESYNVRAATDSKSLAITPTGRGVSPAFCVGTEHPSFRLFAKRTSGSWGVLTVAVRWSVDGGPTNQTVVGAVTTGTAWSPTQSFGLAPVLGLWNDAQTATAQIVLEPEDYGGAWAVDDVYVDPYTRN
jgi:hypothetical protein